ncbi:AraC family transcriptional regulator [Sphingobacterium puteale]|uniref:AraC family transcriptional regulator n=1 Tax=Sphingobacterium puteale TaxID=2420510 RepID=A0A420VSG3_9SPHI|nr:MULTISPECIES: AraC family transcriptional regulator [Sphingobacterium]QIH34767.1 helix-turn-helix transcriptional regulator [Sphingobacterium sp. DR205]RKO69207.1 AraC family transcriptional regulator [Sphingobacterium puteale]
MEILRSFGQKKIGYLQLDTTIPFDSVSLPCHKSGDCYIILFAGSGSTVISDFVEYKAEQDTLFFFNIGQQFQMDNNTEGELVYFNPEFYCIAFHDKELTCDGVLFNNVFETPSITLTEDEGISFRKVIAEIKGELNREDYWTEEMTRTKLKELIITASRSWLDRSPEQKGPRTMEDALNRKFSELVETNYHKNHSVADYAELLFISPKTLNRKIVREKGISPNTIIKNRIILQAKRLLINTDLKVKEIAAQLGYDDQSYFVRFFRIQTGKSPFEFKRRAISE